MNKREVLFAGSAEFQELLVSTVAAATESAPPIDAVAAGLDAIGSLLQERPEFARARANIIAANAELRERELIKLGSMSAALADTLRERGLADPTARLTAEVAISVFRIAFERWIDESNERPLPQLMRDALDQLRLVVAVDARREASPSAPVVAATRP
jgi:hypothetical protein